MSEQDPLTQLGDQVDSIVKDVTPWKDIVGDTPQNAKKPEFWNRLLSPVIFYFF